MDERVITVITRVDLLDERPPSLTSYSVDYADYSMMQIKPSVETNHNIFLAKEFHAIEHQERNTILQLLRRRTSTGGDKDAQISVLTWSPAITRSVLRAEQAMTRDSQMQQQ